MTYNLEVLVQHYCGKDLTSSVSVICIKFKITNLHINDFFSVVNFFQANFPFLLPLLLYYSYFYTFISVSWDSDENSEAPTKNNLPNVMKMKIDGEFRE